MRTRTIFEAFKKASCDPLYAEEWRQLATFEAELLRRMDERDALVPLARRVGDAHFEWVVSEDGTPEKDAHEQWDEASFILGGYMNNAEAR